MIKNLKGLMESGYVSMAKLPEKNDFPLSNGKVDFNKLEALDGYTVPLNIHDYSAKTPLMWNTLYEKLKLNIRNIMVVADPKNAEMIMSALKNDPKYIGGGFGVGWKEQLDVLDEIRPHDLKSVNIVAKENGKLIGYNTDALGFVRSLEDKFFEIGKNSIKGKNIIILGAGGVAKEVSKEIAKRKPNRIVILNRTFSRAVDIAKYINDEYGGKNGIASGAGEEFIRSSLLNTDVRPDAVINLTDKGSDGPLAEYAAFAAADTECANGPGNNLTISRTNAKELALLNPDIIVADIVLPKSGRTITLRIAENYGLTNLLDGIPMVVNQAAPAHIYVQNASPEMHKKKVNEEQALEIFRESVYKEKS